MRSRIVLLMAVIAALGMSPSAGVEEDVGHEAGGGEPLGICVHVRPVDPHHAYCVWMPRPL